MTEDNPSPARGPTTCPLCGGDNQCAVTTGSPVGDCWCAGATIDPARLAAIASATRACLCPACAGLRGDTTCEET